MQQSRVDLRQASVSALPFSDGAFNKALALHSLVRLAPLEVGLRELHRVVLPGGRLALGVRKRSETARIFEPSRYGLIDEQVAEICAVLDSVGFVKVQTQQRQFRRETVCAILATRH